MKQLHACVLIPVLTLLLPFRALSSDSRLGAWDETTPSYPLFSSGIIQECPKCETFVIIAATTSVSKELTDAFKRVVTRFPESVTHQGVVMKRAQLLTEANELTVLHCPLPDVRDTNVAYYADRRQGKCIKISYESEVLLSVALERMFGYLGDPAHTLKDLRDLQQDEADRRFRADAAQFIGKYYPIVADLVGILAPRVLGRHAKGAALPIETR